ncbi:MAG: hypothetical protein MJA29_08015, partial [Candidatus Omnitrophica bacterium]|nr:hypothetical protein [Candidatus Omnitrophota bacterium]
MDSIAQKAKKGVTAIKVMANADTQQKVLVLLVQMLVLSVMDYGLGLLTLSQTQIQRLERIQNEAMRAALGCTRDTPIACMRYLLDLPSIKVRYKLAQVKEYLRVVEKTGHPLHASVGDDKGYRLKRGKSWMAAAEDTLSLVCDIDDIARGEEWVQLEDHEDRNTVIITLGRECREWQAGVTDT